ncbi:LysR family transcriptional regulator [Burkholderia multivorans]|uniref:LysR family transcriptional regulator n=1 Tax=Burkholderia multivorans TaxID=87883 RepID=UPI000CFE6E81|nr:LysR family transcriptional regulator [Burkholderia multivorans]PRG77677.1 LysR family transcriptional regulator [Burkholderia multivorans]
MRGQDFFELRAFLTLSQCNSFSQAAAATGITASAFSQLIRRLEARLGTRLVNRTTRSVSLTEAGVLLASKIAPAIADLTSAVDTISQFSSEAIGTVKIGAIRLAASVVLEPLLRGFTDAHPRIVLDLTLDDGVADPVAAGFDATIRLGETIETDMVAIPLTGELRQCVVASPDYLARFGRPVTPMDLRDHRCINWRWPGQNHLYAWEFAEQGRPFQISVQGPLIVSDRTVAVAAATAGVGIAQVNAAVVDEALNQGALVSLLDDWCPSFPGFQLCLPRQRQMPSALRAFIDYVRAHGAS